MHIVGTEYSLKNKCLEIYLAGCKAPHCRGCHNVELQSFDVGTPWREYVKGLDEKIGSADRMIETLIIAGGDPLHQAHGEVITFLKHLRETHGRLIVLFTREHDVPVEILDQIDFLKIGRFMEGEIGYQESSLGITLASPNQRIYPADFYGTLKYNKGMVGKSFTTNAGEVCQVVSPGETSKYCTVIFAGHPEYEKSVPVRRLRQGRIKSPFCRTTCGVGYLGVGCYPRYDVDKEISPIYAVWRRILHRCYSSPAPRGYEGCSVYEGWHNFQTFAKWATPKFQEGYHIDKDLLSVGNKVYGPELCIFLPPRINYFIAHRESSGRGSSRLGVSVHTVDGRFVAQGRTFKTSENKHLGLFSDEGAAGNAYQDFREEQVGQAADFMRSEGFDESIIKFLR